MYDWHESSVTKERLKEATDTFDPLVLSIIDGNEKKKNHSCKEEIILKSSSTLTKLSKLSKPHKTE